MLNHRLTRLTQILTAVLTMLAGAMVLVALVAPAPGTSAATGKCAATKKHPRCLSAVSTQWVTDTDAKILISTRINTTVRLTYSSIHETKARTKTDPTMRRDHAVELNNLVPGSSYTVLVSATASDGSHDSRVLFVDTYHRKLTIKVDKIYIDDDGDNLSDGDIRAGIHLSGDNSPNDSADPIFNETQIATGHFVTPNKTFTYYDRLGTTVLHIGAIDIDESGCGPSWTDPYYIPNGSGSTPCSDYASAYANIPRDPDGIPYKLVLSGQGGMSFHAYVTVTDSLV